MKEISSKILNKLNQNISRKRKSINHGLTNQTKTKPLLYKNFKKLSHNNIKNDLIDNAINENKGKSLIKSSSKKTQLSQIKSIIPLNKDNNKNNIKEKYYWFAAYDKLMKRKKLLKIFSFYNLASNNNISYKNKKNIDDFNKIIEKEYEIKNYEIYFIKNMNRPLIRKSEGNKIFVNLYLLTLKQINMILSYLNRFEYNNYIENLDKLCEKYNYVNIFNNKTNNDTIQSINVKYSTIYYLGYYMNIPIYSFSRLEKENNFILNKEIPLEIEYFPNSKKIAKLIKLLLLNFPYKTKEYFIDYIFTYYKNMNKSEIYENMLREKKKEITHLLISKKKSLYKLSPENINSIKIGGFLCPEVSFSSYLSSLNKNNNLNSNSNNLTNNNIKNNINNNLGNISISGSYFDFTSDIFISMRQNEENLSKAMDSLRSLSYKNKYTTNNDNTSLSKINQTTNIINNKIKYYSSNLGENQKKNLSKISKFSYENATKNKKSNIMKINNLKKEASKNIKKDIDKNISDNNNNAIPIIPSLIQKCSLNSKKRIIDKTSIRNNILNFKNSYNKFNYKFIPFLTDGNNTINSLEDNKENDNIISNFGDIKNNKISFEDFKRKSFLKKGNYNKKSKLKEEDIFISSKINNSYMYIMDKKGFKSFDFDYKKRKGYKGFKISHKCFGMI